MKSASVTPDVPANQYMTMVPTSATSAGNVSATLYHRGKSYWVARYSASTLAHWANARFSAPASFTFVIPFSKAGTMPETLRSASTISRCLRACDTATATPTTTCTARTAIAGTTSDGAYAPIWTTYTSEKTAVSPDPRNMLVKTSTMLPIRLTRFARSPAWRFLKNEGGSERRRAIMAASICMASFCSIGASSPSTAGSR